MAELTIAVAVLGDRLLKLNRKSFPKLSGISYDLFAQRGNDSHSLHADANLSRPDIRVFWLDSIGVAESRNMAIEHAESEYVLFADDDVQLLTENYQDLLTKFQNNPSVDFLCARLLNEHDAPYKTYGEAPRRVNRINCGRVGTPEMAIRVARFRERQIRFDPRFGAGAPLPSGDEYIFLCDALRAKIAGLHCNVYVARHKTDSTGHATDEDAFRTRKQVIERAIGKGAWVFRVAFALKHIKAMPNWKTFFHFISL